jgi:beta-lactamase regulating signal transducer with metallopeptidase domain
MSAASGFAVDAMGLRYVVEPAARTLVLGGAAWLLLGALRVKEVSLRLAAWTIVLYAALAMPFLSRIIPEVPLPVLSSATVQTVAGEFASWNWKETAAGPVARLAVFQPSSPSSLRIGDAGTGSDAELAALNGKSAPRTAFSWPVAAFIIYLLIMAVLMGRIVLGWISSRRLRRSGAPVLDERLHLLLAREAHQAGLENPPKIVESAALSVPATLGWLRPTILLPVEWTEWTEPETRAVLAHELSHIARRDALTQTLSRIHRAFFWFSPLSWWLDHALVELAEQASDDAALRSGADRVRYAEVLLHFFRALRASRGRVRWEGVSMAQGTRSERRIERILYDSRLSRGIGAAALAAVALAAAPLICLAAAIQPSRAGTTLPLPVSAAPPAPPALAFTPVSPAPGISTGASAAARQVAVKFTPGEKPWNGEVCRGDHAFAIVSGRSAVGVCASAADLDRVWQLHRRIRGSFLWFQGNGRHYVVRDPAIVNAALGAFAPLQTVARKQADLKREECVLVHDRLEFDARQMTAEFQVPAAWPELREFEIRLLATAPTATPQDLARLRAELEWAEWRAMQDAVAAQELIAERNLLALNRQQAALYAQQISLRRRQARLDWEQAELAGKAVGLTGALIDRSLAQGLARPL